jgi:hypothetical protein
MPYNIDFTPEPEKKTQDKSAKSSGSSLSLFEKLLTLVIAWQFFHFTGKAIANGKKLPKDWLKLKDRILPKKLREILEDKKEKTPTAYKVVDIATNEPISIP